MSIRKSKISDIYAKYFWFFMLTKIKRESCFYSFFELVVMIFQNFSLGILENDLLVNVG